ncbi:unnamed protein product [Musa acuminata subsp. malaccensis]|uniref:(wild Malaysian banana) hypothetical protein n=1 Tax=Musa acuminata subsp. malaccensis TaxID=214687 RepID=A0A8D7ABB0_MUSAM|nr:unnamed protein product [Musa acuminata subsp. malaccensis]
MLALCKVNKLERNYNVDMVVDVNLKCPCIFDHRVLLC